MKISSKSSHSHKTIAGDRSPVPQHQQNTIVKPRNREPHSRSQCSIIIASPQITEGVHRRTPLAHPPGELACGKLYQNYKPEPSAMPPPSVSLREPPPSRGRLWTAQTTAQPADQRTCPCTTRISAFFPELRDGEPVPYQAAQRHLTHLLIPTHNPQPNEQTKERATAPRGYRPSL